MGIGLSEGEVVGHIFQLPMFFHEKPTLEMSAACLLTAHIWIVLAYPATLYSLWWLLEKN